MIRFIRKKRGVASLEFVMCLPFIVLVTAIIFRFGMASLAKSKVAVDVRREVWQARSDYSGSSAALKAIQKDDTTALSVFSFVDSLDGKIAGEANHTVKNYSWLGGDRIAVSKTTIIARTWDHRELGDLTADDMPHLELIGQMLGSAKAAEWISKIKDAIAWLFKLKQNGRIPTENDDEIDAANDEVAEAEAEFEEKRAELVAAKEQAEADLAALKVERQAYLDEQAALEQEERDLRSDISRWESQVPMTPETQAKIDAARTRLGEVNDRLRVVDSEIQRLDSEIRAKEREIEEYETQLAKLEEVLNGEL